MDIKENIELKNFCTFLIGGPAQYLATWKDHDDIKEIVSFAKENNLKITVFGGGTNLLFPDQGVNGVVVRTMSGHIENSDTELVVDAGVTWARLMPYLRKNELYGLEAFSGLPGTIGGATYGNAGCHGTEMKDVIIKVECFDTEKEEFVTLQRDKIEYDYRHSSFKENKHLIISRIWLRVSKNPEDNTGDPQHFAEFRKQNQPQGLTTGSFFKNPEGDYAGRLIEEAGLKGHKVGGIQSSEKHANFFINDGTAKAADVIEMRDLVIATVEEKSGVKLEPEVQIIES